MTQSKFPIIKRNIITPFFFVVFVILLISCQSANFTSTITELMTPSPTLMLTTFTNTENSENANPQATEEEMTITPTTTKTVEINQSATFTVGKTNQIATPIIMNTDLPISTFTPTIENTLAESQTPTVFFTPTKTLVPTRTPYPTLTRRPSRTPSITPSPTPPLAFFRINNLGMYSKVISPVRPEAIVSPGEDGLIHVELIDETTKTIQKEVFDYSNYAGRHFGISPEIDFTLDSVSESARLIITSFDRYERIMWLTSVDLVLLSIGKNQITAPTDFTEPYIIRLPKENDEIQGGMLQVTGLARILNSNPIILECVDSQGKIITSTQIELHASIEGMSHIPFSEFLPYQVSESTNVRLTIRQESNNRIPGTISLFSYEITLLP
ncbi:MAG: hypothetical protein CVU46_07410 [Chloroflexi bacterium HGW-Chloroflexi-8]|nr:MAG: hypothetical protein CVU46_07410 [Chloroflexi bacterium HGW-Chloroflexi-8]